MLTHILQIDVVKEPVNDGQGDPRGRPDHHSQALSRLRDIYQIDIFITIS